MLTHFCFFEEYVLQIRITDDQLPESEKHITDPRTWESCMSVELLRGFVDGPPSATNQFAAVHGIHGFVQTKQPGLSLSRRRKSRKGQVR